MKVSGWHFRYNSFGTSATATAKVVAERPGRKLPTYHISDDKRTHRSAELIWQGLEACLAEKPFGQITVSDLQRASGVARTTFYRSFDNISDVLYWKCGERFAECFDSYRPDTAGADAYGGELDLARHFFSYWFAHPDIPELLITINRQDIIYASHLKAADSMVVRFGRVPGLNPTHGRYYMAIRTGIMISLLTAWLQGGRKETPDDMMGILEEQVRLLGNARPRQPDQM